MTAKTSQHLAEVLRAAGFITLATRAEADEFHDYLSPHATPAMELDKALHELGVASLSTERVRQAALNIRLRLQSGEFDASEEEADEWAASHEGQELLRKLHGKPKP